MDQKLNLEKSYILFVEDIKTKIKAAQYKAARTVNSELIILYWTIGKMVLEKQSALGWGSKVIHQLSKDLSAAFPEMKGFGTQNLKYMRRFAEEYTEHEIGQQAVDQLPWGHNILLMYAIKDKEIRAWYIAQALQYGWSRSILEIQIETKLRARQGKAITNFETKLPFPQSDLAQQTLKDPYIFDFLSIGKEAHEREIEKGLIQHVEKFLLELGEGFAFLGRQHHLKIGNEDYYLDLLFYHVKLKCYVVIELKAGKLKPEHFGKMIYYLSAVDDLIKDSSDNPTIGLILCKSKGEVNVEYALRDVNKPIGFSEYKLSKAIPEDLKTALPSIEQLEEELAKDFADY